MRVKDTPIMEKKSTSIGVTSQSGQRIFLKIQSGRFCDQTLHAFCAASTDTTQKRIAFSFYGFICSLLLGEARMAKDTARFVTVFTQTLASVLPWCFLYDTTERYSFGAPFGPCLGDYLKQQQVVIRGAITLRR